MSSLSIITGRGLRNLGLSRGFSEVQQWQIKDTLPNGVWKHVGFPQARFVSACKNADTPAVKPLFKPLFKL